MHTTNDEDNGDDVDNVEDVDDDDVDDAECHHRFSIDLIVIFSAKNGKLFLDHTDPLRNTTRII